MELGTELKYYQQQILDRIKQEYPFHRPSNLRPYEPDTNHYLQQLTLTDAEYKELMHALQTYPELQKIIEAAEQGDDNA